MMVNPCKSSSLPLNSWPTVRFSHWGVGRASVDGIRDKTAATSGRQKDSQMGLQTEPQTGSHIASCKALGNE
jgi:hypothetical protein